jgi:hypothetical protein
MHGRIADLNTHCLAEFRTHWQCLEQGNQQLWQCRPQEWKLNKCAYTKLVGYAEQETSCLPGWTSYRSIRWQT